LHIQDATFEHPYISALGSHTAYWRDEDTALFVTRHLYRDVPESPPGTEEPDGATGGASQEVVGGTNRGKLGIAGEDEKTIPGTASEKVAGVGDGSEKPTGKGGMRSKHSSTGSFIGLKRSRSVGDQLTTEDGPGESSTLGSLLWGGPRLRRLQPETSLEGPATQFDTWIADDETGLFYMPGGAATLLNPTVAADCEKEDVSKPGHGEGAPSNGF
jgi:hypothetical protein